MVSTTKVAGRLALAVVAAATVMGATPAVAAKPAAVEVVARFDPSRDELPEAFARLDGSTYLSMSSRLMRLLPDGVLTTHAQFPAPSPLVFALGVEVGPDGALYVGLGSFSAADGVASVWRVTTDGQAEEFVHLDDAGFPNDLVFDDAGNMFVTDPFLGRIWKVTPEGVASDWITHPSLKGDPPVGYLMLHDFGADGIAFDRTKRTLYVGNLDRGQIIRIPVGDDGAAGAPEIWVDDDRLDGVDGITFDDSGTLFAAVNGQDQIVRITRDRELSVIASDGALDAPSAVEFGAPGELYVSSFAINSRFGTIRSRHPLQPEPALLRISPAK